MTAKPAPSNHQTRRQFLLGLILLGLLGLAWSSGRWGLAEWQAIQLRDQLVLWEAAESITVTEWEQALVRTDQLISYNPDNAQYLQLKANMLALVSKIPRQELSAFSDANLSDQEREEYLNSLIADSERRQVAETESLLLYKSAAESRPTWPLGWLDYLARLADAEQLNEEFDFALRQSIRFSGDKSDARLRLTQIFVLLVNRTGLNDSTWHLFMEHLQHVLSSQASQSHLRLLTSGGALTLVCPELVLEKLEERARVACQQELARWERVEIP